MSTGDTPSHRAAKYPSFAQMSVRLITNRQTIERAANAAAVATDVAEFETALDAAAADACPTRQVAFLIQAVDLYRGPLLPGHYVDLFIREQQRW